MNWWTLVLQLEMCKQNRWTKPNFLKRNDLPTCNTFEHELFLDRHDVVPFFLENVVVELVGVFVRRGRRHRTQADLVPAAAAVQVFERGIVRRSRQPAVRRAHGLEVDMGLFARVDQVAVEVDQVPPGLFGRYRLSDLCWFHRLAIIIFEDDRPPPRLGDECVAF